MKCIICHGDNIQVKEVKEEIFLGNDIVHIPIKIPVCMTCGERYYDNNIPQHSTEDCNLLHSVRK